MAIYHIFSYSIEYQTYTQILTFTRYGIIHPAIDLHRLSSATIRCNYAQSSSWQRCLGWQAHSRVATPRIRPW